MQHNQQIRQLSHTDSTSRLEQFSLGFEYDKTLQQVKREVRIRTI